MLLLIALGCAQPAEAIEPEEVIPAGYVQSVQCGPEHADRSLDLGTLTPFGLQVWSCDGRCDELHTRWTVERSELVVSCAQEIRYEARWLIVGS